MTPPVTLFVVVVVDLHSFNRDNAKSFTLVITSAWYVPDFLGRVNCKEERRECLKGELRLVGSRGILSQPIVLLFVLHRFVRCHRETGIWDSQTTYCWTVYAPQVCAEPHRDRDMIWGSQGHEFGIWDFQATYCSAVCVPKVCALPHRDRDLNFKWIYVQFRLWKKYNVYAGWQKLRGSTGGTRRKVWTRTKILSPNIRYFVAN